MHNELDINNEHLYTGAKFLCVHIDNSEPSRFALGEIFEIRLTNMNAIQFTGYNDIIDNETFKSLSISSCQDVLHFVPVDIITEEALFIFKLSHKIEDLYI